jgi:bifunctional UDP-N-acetylglucosamine pyrophosphorylase/glucosamine-1-phosphate N-acetyltransferase
MKNSLDVCILAAGKGTRMKSSIPKMLHEVAGKALLAHVIDSVGNLSVNQIFVVVGSGSEQVEAAFSRANLQFVRQSEQLGTGHAVQQAAPLLSSDRTLILLGDAPLISETSLERLINTDGDLVVLTADHPNPANYGRIVRDEDEVLYIVEDRDASAVEKQIREINTGVMVADTAKLKLWLQELSTDNDQKEYLLPDIVKVARQQGCSVFATLAESFEEALGVNNFVQLSDAERAYQVRTAKEYQLGGVHIVDPTRFTRRGELQVGREVMIDVDCVFEGKVELGDGVRIGANCVIKNATIGTNSIIKPFTHIEGAVMEENCQAGPFSRLRPGTYFEPEVAVGNFVEVKKSRLGAGTKASHLSYLGDATIGKDVNIGAGAITCNYDGVNKHQTQIDDNVFIGVNAALVAPITISEWSTVGAGSTITTGVPLDSLSVGRAKQRNIEGWKGPRHKARDEREK